MEPSYSTKPDIMQVFARPFVMTVQEPILLFTSLYLALVFAVLYLFFQAYPVIFQGKKKDYAYCHVNS